MPILTTLPNIQNPGQVAGQAAPAQTVTPSQLTGATSTEEVQGLRVRLELLREGLQDAATRRRNNAEQLRSIDSKAVPGVERRIAELDDRIIAMEREITNTELRLSMTPPHLLSQAAERSFVPSGDINPNQVAADVVANLVPIVAIISVFFLAPIGIAISRLLWKRASHGPRPVTDAATQQRLESLQQSVDTIAIEVERISEGQRFVTRLLSDRDRAALEAGRK